MAEETKTQKPAVGHRKQLSGVVVSSKMKDTSTVSVTRYVKHPRYKKFVKRIKKYLVHDEGNTHAVGEKVTIEETKPISKNKSFVIIEKK